jgi:hypothetical protein
MDVPMEDGELRVPVGRIDEVTFPVTKGTLEDEPLAPPDVLEESGRDPVPVGPAEVVELAGIEYGADDEMVPPARLEELA